MNTVTAVKIRILRLCDERGLSINRLATICAAAVKHQEYSVREKPESKASYDKMICDGLDITLGEFFSTPEFDALEQEIK